MTDTSPSFEGRIGLARTTVAVCEYCADWPALYAAEAASLKTLLGNDMLAVEHVGSTAIPGMPAKPIIDIMVAVPDLEVAATWQQPLAEMGYERRTNGDVEDRRFFAKGPRSCRTHHLSLTLEHGSYWTEHIAFRDTLIKQPDLATRYANLKRELARLHPNDRGAYTAAKAAFVAEVLKMAERARPCERVDLEREATHCCSERRPLHVADNPSDHTEDPRGNAVALIQDIAASCQGPCRPPDPLASRP